MPELRELLERGRRELLDLSTRNRLLSVPVSSTLARVIHVQDELAREVFRLLVRERKTLSFLPGRKAPAPLGRLGAGPVRNEPAPGLMELPNFALEEEAEIGLPPPPDEVPDASSGLARRHVDGRLQTVLTPEALQRRLLDLYRDAQTTIEETGVNVLYLALGQLKWFEAEAADTPRFAPLVLVPVELSRKTAAERFYLRAREEDVEENLSLRAKLQADFGLELPEFPDPDELDLDRYFAAVRGTIVGERNWDVVPNAMTLGFFSFAKFLMYRDLDPETWPEDRPLLENSFLSALLGAGFPPAEAPIPDETHLDDLIPVERLDHVVDADGSQTLALEMVRQGRSLVIQGPPGTGKSQSITNIIATAVLDGKKVLFVAEKLAALEVVKRRLEREKLGDLCLELHSNKASKRAVLEEIKRTWRLGQPIRTGLEGVNSELEARRAALNGHAQALHAVHPSTGLTPFRVIGELARLGKSGASAAEIDLPGAEAWDAVGRSNREQGIVDIAERIEQIGVPALHPWRGVRRETVLQIDLAPLLALARGAAEKLAACRASGRALAEALRVDEPIHFTSLSWLALMADHVARAPSVDRQALGAGAWSAGWERIRDLVAAGQRFATAVRVTAEQVTEAAWEKDFGSTRSGFAAHGRSWLRFLHGDYRRSMAELRGVLKGAPPGGFEARLALIDELVAGQRALCAVRSGDGLGAAAFGTLWRRERSDWLQLEQIVVWVDSQRAAGLGHEFRQLFATIDPLAAVGTLGVRLRNEIRIATDALNQLVAALRLDPAAAFGVATLEEARFDELEARLTTWLREPESLSRWTNFFMRLSQGRELGLGPLLDGLYSGAIAPGDAKAAFRRACFSRILRELARLEPALARFDGESHTNIVREFRELDEDRLTLARYRVLAAHHQRLPEMNAGIGAVGIVRSELERQRGHRPIRQLLRDAGGVVQAIKPVFMMSPLSVAQFLEKGAVEFDLLVVDEASQVQPVDALGAIARCKQIVVVGDSRQLPPTRFFARVTSDLPQDDEEQVGAAQVQDIESILGLCCARGLPQAMLRWHYRSRHHSLIAVSNHEFYEDRLFIVPSPYATSSELGLRFRHVADGIFDSGSSGTNRVEAKAVCQAVIEHARQHPALSLGVAAFSVRQQQAILDELELLRREHDETEPFFNAHPTEPFFVKNLENVQGDERDVIFISIGYGRDLNGYMAMRFGPLGNEGGERRLNVLISRARKRCEVFSSITAEDIDLERAQGRGVHSLKSFLQFARTGKIAVAQRSGREEDSPFEEAVRAALEAQGVAVHAQVGVAGFFIDLAVLHREQPGRYVLGIECDGAAYHSSRSARDRDRLRQAVLEDHGWVIHRIWSTDWFQRPEEQLRRVVTAIESAQVATVEPSRPDASLRQAAPADIAREDQEQAESTLSASVAEPYRPAEFKPPPRREPHELSTRELADVLFRIVQEEGPIHEDELVTRVKDIWRFQRAGARIQDAVGKGVRLLLVTQRCVREECCLAVPGAPVRVRNRENVSCPGVRKPDLLPPAEIRAALLALVEAARGAARRELPTAVARLLGFRTTTALLRERVESQIHKLEQTGALSEVQGLLQRATDSNGP